MCSRCHVWRHISQFLERQKLFTKATSLSRNINVRRLERRFRLLPLWRHSYEVVVRGVFEHPSTKFCCIMWTEKARELSHLKHWHRKDYICVKLWCTGKPRKQKTLLIKSLFWIEQYQYRRNDRIIAKKQFVCSQSFWERSIHSREQKPFLHFKARL